MNIDYEKKKFQVVTHLIQYPANEIHSISEFYAKVHS